MKTGGSSKTGFTIIEVVLVLAVAGLIFIMVFVALPALQRSQRDNARREDLMDFIAKAKDYSQNNRGALPGSAESNTDAIINVTWSEVHPPATPTPGVVSTATSLARTSLIRMARITHLLS